jgi:hypothetical protein
MVGWLGEAEMRHGRLVVVILVTLAAPAAFGQGVISPYTDDGPPAPPQYAPPQYAPVSPPLIAPPPPGCCPQPCAQSQYYAPASPYCTLAPPALGVHEEEQPRYGLMTAGIIVLGASWSINAATAYLANEWKLAVPVVGPFLETQNISTSSNDANRMVVGLLVFDGLIETAGAAMFLAGAFTKHKVRVRDRMRVSFVPTAGRAAAGVAAYGSF